MTWKRNGSCQEQSIHARTEAQAECKQQVGADPLTRIGGLNAAPVREIIGAAQPWAYRNRVRFHVDADGRRVTPVQEYLLTEPLNEREHDRYTL